MISFRNMMAGAAAGIGYGLMCKSDNFANRFGQMAVMLSFIALGQLIDWILKKRKAKP